MLGTFRKVLLTWCFVLLLVLFPLDLLFRIDSFVKFLSFMGIARICSGIVILFTALAVMLDQQEMNNLVEREPERVQSMYSLIRDRIALSERNREHSIYSNSR